MKITRPRLRLPKRGTDPRAALVAFVLQVGLIALIVPTLIVPFAFQLLRDDAGRPVTPERISFITALPVGGEPTREAPRAGGDGRLESDAPRRSDPLPPIIAPTEVPTAVFPNRNAPRGDPEGIGPLVGGGGPTRGIRPSFTDRRLWIPESDIVLAPAVPLTRADSLRVMLAERTMGYLDSLARLPVERQPGDWTIERGGKKYGVDSRFIRLGDFSIPTALLAMLPMNAQANPIERERALRLDQMRNEIQMQASRVARDDEFRAAVRALRERRERERKEADAKKAGTVAEPARP